MILSLKKFTVSAPAKVPKERKRKTATDAVRPHGEVEPRLLDLVRLRVAQIHDCKWCALGHIKNLKAQGETPVRLRLLKDWRRASVFSDREEAALNLAEALTHNPIGAVSDDVVHATFFYFNESEMLCLILTILAANDWHYLKSFQNGNMTSRPPHE